MHVCAATIVNVGFGLSMRGQYCSYCTSHVMQVEKFQACRFLSAVLCATMSARGRNQLDMGARKGLAGHVTFQNSL